MKPLKRKCRWLTLPFWIASRNLARRPSRLSWMTMSSLWTPTSLLQHIGTNAELQHYTGTTRSRMRQISRSARVSKCGWIRRILFIRCSVRLTYQSDEDFSLTHIAAFEPPAHRSGMHALLEHSRQTYGPLPSELRRIRSRTNSRPTPYPQPQRAVRVSTVRLDNSTIQTSAVSVPSTAPALIPQALQQRPVNPNAIVAEASPLVTGKKAKVDSVLFSQSHIDFDARRTAPGRGTRRVGKENKENTASPGVMTAYVSILPQLSVTDFRTSAPETAYALTALDLVVALLLLAHLLS